MTHQRHAIEGGGAGAPPADVSAEEWAVRVDLAAAYRLVARLGWDDLIYNHISARVPGRDDHFLINPFGLSFDEVTASSLVKIDHEARIVGPSRYGVNGAGFVIHHAVHRARPELNCVMHLHTEAGGFKEVLRCPLPNHTVVPISFLPTAGGSSWPRCSRLVRPRARTGRMRVRHTIPSRSRAAAPMPAPRPIFPTAPPRARMPRCHSHPPSRSQSSPPRRA